MLSRDQETKSSRLPLFWFVTSPFLLVIAVGNGPFIELYLLRIVIFHGYVKEPDGKSCEIPSFHGHFPRGMGISSPTCKTCDVRRGTQRLGIDPGAGAGYGVSNTESQDILQNWGNCMECVSLSIL